MYEKSILIISTLLFSSPLFADFPGSNMGNLNSSNNLQGNLSKGTTAPAIKVMSYSNNKLDKLEFKFSGGSAWVNQKGDWYVKGVIKHNRIRCANYQIGIRFGKGENGCDNPEWQTDYEYGTNVKQCNSAELEHIGGGYFSELEKKIENITCAQIDIKCFGSTCNE